MLVLNPMTPLMDGVYLGDPDQDLTWKISTSESGDLVFLKRINGEWVPRHCIN
jgi:hypothetical protein